MASLYADLDAVRVEIPNTTFDANSLPSADTVDAFCLEISSEIDAIIRGTSVVLPVTDAAALVFLKRLALAGILSRVYSVMRHGQDARDFEDKYQHGLKRIENNPQMMNPIDAGPRLDTVRNTYPDPAASSTPPRPFRKGEEQW